MTKNKKTNKDIFEKSAEIYKLMANPKRLEILDLVSDKEMIVNDIVDAMGVRKANVSQHLAILRYLRFVNVRRSGKNAFYSIDPKIAKSFKAMNELWRE
jgi:ArsR family transcriptional regulator, virulence genes transcriptional regulator